MDDRYVIGKVLQRGRLLSVENESLRDFQHSANLYLELDIDPDAGNPFAGTALSAPCRSRDDTVVCPVLLQDDGKHYILLREEVFQNAGEVDISIGGINEDKIVVTSNMIKITISDSGPIKVTGTPPESYWEIEVLNAMKAWYADVVEPTFDASSEKLNQLIRRTEEHEEKVEELQQKVQEQQNQVADAISDADQATQTANAAAVNADEKAVAANTAAKAANTAKAGADQAKTAANEAAEEANTAASNANAKAGEAATAAAGAITAKNDAVQAAKNANDKATAAATATQSANLAKEATEAATKNADEMVKQVQQKLSDGDFIGEKGTSYKNQGIWTSNKAYKCDSSQIDTVNYSGAMYGCIKSHTSSASITPVNATYWVKMAAQGDPGPTVVKLDSVTQDQLLMTKTRTANPSYVAVQFKTTDGKVLAFEVSASQVRISNDVTLDQVLAGNSFYISHVPGESVTYGNYDEWIAAGKPTMPSNFD